VTNVGEPTREAANVNRSSAASQLIIDIASAAAGGRDLDQILHETLDRLRSIAPLTGGSIALVEGDELVVRAAVGPFADAALGQRLKRGPSVSWTVVETLEPRLIPDMQSAGLKVRGTPEQGAICSWLAVPIVRRGKGIGLLEIDSTLPEAFGPADLEILESVVRILSGPVELADHYAAERRARELQDAFVGVVSHELRTPITTIYGLSKMLRQRGDRLDPDVRTRAIEDVEAEADRLHRLVEDLLVLSRAERGAVEIEGEPIGITRLLRRVLEAERIRLGNRTVELEIDGHLPLVLGEETYVEQVVRNLVTNAAKYSDPPAPIRVVASEADGEVTIRVLDEGIGMGGEDAERAFELFFRSPSASKVASGAGIGLFVCRQLVEAMGGRIWVAPRDGAGTEVGFSLPVHVDDEEDGA
jgi:signal transduction histidine kinase